MGIHLDSSPKLIWNESFCISPNPTNLTRAIGSAAFELSDTVILAISFIFTIVNASCQRHPIDIETLIPVCIYGNILMDSFLIW